MMKSTRKSHEAEPTKSATGSLEAKALSGDRAQFSAPSGNAGKADSRILEAFGPNVQLDQYRLPVPPRTLSDSDPLLEPTKGKKSAILDPDHILVLSGRLPGGAEIPRKQLHNAIVQYFLEQGRPVPAGDQPVVIAAGGGGGSGKSTVLRKLELQGQLSVPGAVTVNPDDIASLLPEFARIKATGDSRAASTVHSEASHLSERLMEALLAQPPSQRSHIVYDSTLAWKDSALKHFQRWRSHGYQINLIGVTAAPQEAMVRAAIRAKKSGRWVPHDVLAQAHAGFNSSVRDYLQYVDEAHLLDNTGSSQASIATKDPATGKIHIVNQELWDTLVTRGQQQ